MDLRLYFNVLWRFRRLIAVGLGLAGVLVFLTLVRVSFGGGSPQFEYRDQEVWESKSRAVLSHYGFPWGRAVIEPEEGDADRLFLLAELYAQFAKSDGARALALKAGPLPGTYTASAVGGPQGLLPFVTITGTGPSPRAARAASSRGLDALRTYIAQRQQAARINPKKRVRVDILWKARPAELVEGRRMTLPVLVFISVTMAFVALAFVLENLRPRVRTIETAPESLPVSEARRSA